MYKINIRKLGIPDRLYHKILLIMRLTTVFIIASLMQVSAATFGQRITLNQQNTTLESIFKEIRKQSGYDFFYDAKAINTRTKVNINVNQVTIETALEKALTNLPITYEINENRVTIKQKEEPSFIDNIIARFQGIDVKGTVTDEQGIPVGGATVRAKKGKAATISDSKGQFLLKGVDTEDNIIISYIGFDSKEIQVISNVGNVVLNTATSKLDEVRVQAYSKTSERLSTGNSTGITAKEIQQQPINNPILALQGRIPGIEIYQSTGLPGSGVTIRIQGINSISKGYNPYYVIDGIPYPQSGMPVINEIRGGSSVPAPEGAGAGFGNGSPLSLINPADIESIEVLKDADATAIYGAKAASGAIIITTRKGKPGDTKIDLNYSNGYGQVAQFAEVMNTEQYLNMRRAAFANDGKQPGNTDYDLLGKYGWSLTKTTNWQKELIGGTATFQNANATISGGNSNTQFLVGGNWKKETTVFPGDFGDQSGSARFSLSNSSANKRLKLNFTGGYLINSSSLPSTDLTWISYYMPPNAPQLNNLDGSLNWAQNDDGNSTFSNPLSTLSTASNLRSQNLTSSAIISYEVLKNLTFKVQTGLNIINQSETKKQYLDRLPPEKRINVGDNGRSSQIMNGENSNWSVEPQINYNRTLSSGLLQVILGGSWTENNISHANIFGEGFSSDQLMDNLSSASSQFIDKTIIAKYRTNAIFGQASYNWKDKYIVKVTIRDDLSSRFGSDNVSHVFGSIGGAWIFSNEKFLKDNTSWLSFGKLQASYGTTGSDQIGNYQYLSYYNSNSNSGVGYQGIKGLVSNGLPNPHLQWEETRKLNIGLDLGFFKDRISLNLDYFRNRSSNQLISYPLSATTGFQSITQNWPALVQNKGIELSLSVKNIDSKNFTWNSNFNFTRQRNNLLEFPGLESSSYYNTLFVGQPVNVQHLYRFAGVNQQTGYYSFLDYEGNATSTLQDPRDRQVFINTNPAFSGGISNSFTYKGFSLNFLLQFSKSKVNAGDLLGIRNFPGGFFLSSSDVPPIGNQLVSQLDSWKAVGDDAKYQKFSTLFSGVARTAYRAARNSDYSYVDGSYIKLKNVALSWTFPSELAAKAGCRLLKLNAQAQNLFSFTNYPFGDPERGSFSTLPPLRMITFGVQASF